MGDLPFGRRQRFSPIQDKEALREAGLFEVLEIEASWRFLLTMDRSGVMRHLASIELFNTLDEPTLRDLEGELEIVRISGGKILFLQGDPGDSLYVVINGRLRVSVELPSGKQQTVGEVGCGECIGEMGLLTGEECSATVRAIRDSLLVKLSKEGCQKLSEKHPWMILEITRIIIKRLRQANQPSSRVVNHLSTVAVIPAGKDAPLSDFARRLTKALSAFGSTLHLSSQSLDKLMGPNVTGNINILQWLDDEELKYDFLVYEGDAFVSSWTRRCIRQADRILAVGRAETDPELSEVEAKLLGADSAETTTASQELVLLHQDKSRPPAGTQKWLSPRRVDRHHHILADSKSGFERLARFLTGRAVGLVLGGGGARGFAHIGVIRALEEAGIPIDLIGGTSQGSVMAAQYAMGCDHAAMLAMNRKAYVEFQPLKRDYTFPAVSFLTGKRARKGLVMMFGDTQIEDLWLNYFCVSNNLTRAEMTVHRDGPLWKWTRASCSLPGIAPPVFCDGDLIIDGGLLNNLPVDVMRKLCEGPVIAVDVSPSVDLVTNVPDRDSLSGWELAWNRLNPLAETPYIPGIVDILMRAVSLGSVYHSESVKQQVDLYIHPPIEGFGIVDWEPLDKLVEVGYQFAREKVKEWKGLTTPAESRAQAAVATGKESD